MNYPADKDNYKVETMRDGKRLTRDELHYLYRDINEGTNLDIQNSLTFELPHDVVFKRLSIKQKSSSLLNQLIADTNGQLCLEIDGKPVAGAAGCNPVADYLRLELRWEDYHLGLGMFGDPFYCNEFHGWILKLSLRQ